MDELGLGYSYAVLHFASLPHLHAIAHVRLSLVGVYAMLHVTHLLHPNLPTKPLCSQKVNHLNYPVLIM